MQWNDLPQPVRDKITLATATTNGAVDFQALLTPFLAIGEELDEALGIASGVVLTIKLAAADLEATFDSYA